MRPKTVVSCCGYMAALGTPADWTCPGCGTLHEAEGVPGDPEPYEPMPPDQAGGLPGLAQGVQANLPVLR